MENKEIKYACMQMLTGGMYFAAEAAIGHPAEFMISYPGFDTPKYDKSGNLVDAGNEYNLKEYLKKKGRMVPYYQFDRKPFQLDDDLNPKILKDGNETHDLPDYSNIDLVVAVPVCSGLSSASYGITEETKKSRNANMMYLLKYALNVIKPKVYIFENAPRLMAQSASSVREELESIAKDAGYSIAYYKTDTKLHDNCQKRPRTFIYFFKHDGNRKSVPKLNFENKPITVEELMSRIPKDATQQTSLEMESVCTTMMSYIKSIYGDNWRSKMKTSCMIDEIIKFNAVDEWRKHTMEMNIDDKVKNKASKYAYHILNKLGMGKGFYVFAPIYEKDHSLPAAMFRTIPLTLHFKEDRLYTIREWLTAMGMPYDFEMHGDPKRYYPKIGQNVPVRTAQFIISEAARIIKDWDTVDRTNECQVMFYDNTKQTSSLLATF